ncbi:DUF1223 domain-containing protein [Mucilaginibacter gracilis]|nr:DUF1223 domain-containing protein [Mucilaginibacter gracilis]
MKAFKILMFCTLALLIIPAVYAFKNKANQNKIPQNGFAVVELFTSEGCSSCPPADELVAKILKEDSTKPIYILSYHVDYWNHLGWKDEFSKAQYSDRQRRYAQWLKLSQIYTPQIVVNGTTEFVGSNEQALRGATQMAFKKTNNLMPVLSNVHFTATGLSLQYPAMAGAANCSLLIAFVQNSAQTNVKSGENGGHILNHVNIVRSLNTISIRNQGGPQTVELPAGFNAKTWQVVAFVQNNSTGQILSAQNIVSSVV